ncbi:uncharacterized protein CDV56_105234 [Aspergillus thermomutatus]|uniref:Uncharacterized protein n=1 Tax=Aspergillus thermomutatus TaxID=41047 RepID=A0A397GDV4_ASPTH|nr:uncharacterized protein CDV56_105234 [Aspergillus thermomutatus]RHZ47818.1 hypothetical protein CDV56_105234 [Aspergillus thermomutatus]
MRLVSLALLLSVAVALPSAEKSCSGVGFPCGNATVNAYDCCVPLVCAPGAWLKLMEPATGLPTASSSLICYGCGNGKCVTVKDKLGCGCAVFRQSSRQKPDTGTHGWAEGQRGRVFEAIDGGRRADRAPDVLYLVD